MKKKTFLLLIVIMLVAMLVCTFGACNLVAKVKDKFNQYDEDDSLPEITFTEDMTYDEILDIWNNDVKSYDYQESYFYDEEPYCSGTYCENGFYSKTSRASDYDAFATYFFDDTCYYEILVTNNKGDNTDYDSEINVYDYRGYDYDFGLSDFRDWGFGNFMFEEELWLWFFDHKDDDNVYEPPHEQFKLTIEPNQLCFDISGRRVIFSNFNKADFNISEVLEEYGITDYKALAEEQEIIKYEPLEDDDTKCELSYVGRFLTSIYIPETVNGRDVTSIGSCAFEYCTRFTSITIPSSVTNIDVGVFMDCTGLESIMVDKGNTKYHSAGNCLIETESKTLISGCKTSVIPDDGSVINIGDCAFYGCSELTSITIPDSIINIGDSAFNDCARLANITISDSVTSIGNLNFSCREFVWNYHDYVINYSGTVADWKNIWIYGYDRYCNVVVNCTDGIINVDHNEETITFYSK